MERRNEAFQKVQRSISMMLMMMFFSQCVAQTNLHRPQPVDLSVCGQPQECRQHHSKSRKALKNIRGNHYTVRHFRSQIGRLCLLSRLAGSQSESRSSSTGYGSRFTKSRGSHFQRLDDQDRIELEWSIVDLFDAHLRYFWEDSIYRARYGRASRGWIPMHAGALSVPECKF